MEQLSVTPSGRLLPDPYSTTTREPTTWIPSRTVLTMLRSSFQMADQQPARPPARTESTAWLKATLETAVTTAE